MSDRVEWNGRRVLLVEDESLVSMLAEDILAGAGWDVTLAMRLDEAMAHAASGDFDVAILDVNLGGGDTSYPVASVLLERGTPFLFATGYSAEGIDPRFENQRMVQKPYRPSDLLNAAEGAARSQGSGDQWRRSATSSS